MNKLESSSPKDALCQDWVKLAPVVLDKIFFLISSMFEIGPVVLEKKLKIGNVYRWTDGQTDDGLQAIRKAHLSFQLM